MSDQFTTGMLGPEAVRKLNELWQLAQNSAEGVVSVSDDPNNAITYLPDGLYAPEVDPSLFFQVSNRFFEISSNEVAKQTARQNLGVDIVDGGTFN